MNKSNASGLANVEHRALVEVLERPVGVALHVNL